jgi:hypothetical protein
VRIARTSRRNHYEHFEERGGLPHRLLGGEPHSPGRLGALGSPKYEPAHPLRRDEYERLEAALWVAAMRLYGRRKVADFWDQDHSRSHIARLAALP